MSKSVLFGGSRSLPSSLILRQVVSAFLALGGSVAVGCATGADAQVISVALAQRATSQLAVFAAFGSGGSGAWACSAVSVVRSAAVAGAQVTWWAGGQLSLPLRARLACRSRAALAGCAAAVFFEPGPGSLSVAAVAVSRGLPVFAFATAAPALVPGCAGAWVAASFCGFSCWAWSAAQQPLF